ncbi:hypothetical protein B296_00006788 [Ensete ventricosum]|uniref:Uncharacterized protein n=1 Tax=Ensete ventricosum TaxID=4639 RepID=A0A426ZXG3_ENSVE|nr:hypothetical protein B296_00006788 [Ensete ventricosum]
MVVVGGWRLYHSPDDNLILITLPLGGRRRSSLRACRVRFDQTVSGGVRARKEGGPDARVNAKRARASNPESVVGKAAEGTISTRCAAGPPRAAKWRISVTFGSATKET